MNYIVEKPFLTYVVDWEGILKVLVQKDTDEMPITGGSPLENAIISISDSNLLTVSGTLRGQNRKFISSRFVIEITGDGGRYVKQ